MNSDLAAQVRAVLDVDVSEFRAQAQADAEVVKSELKDGTFDNHRSIIGLEYEFYAVADGRWRQEREDAETGAELVRVPRRLLELIRFEKELGLHNAELTTSPQPLNAEGLRAQSAGVRSHLLSALQTTRIEGMRLVSDGIWTIPPSGETARDYLTDSISDGGVRIATNMTDAVRYHAMANGPNTPTPFTVDAPHVTLEADTVMPESLITSIQPHYQVPHASDLPTYHNYALRVAGPLLALGGNSPFFPPDLYDDGVAPETVVADARAENRIFVFESVLNSENAQKVRFPEDLDTVEEAVDRVANDPTVVPMPVEGGDRFDDKFATLRRKHGTFWRWVRPVFDGADRSSANARIEFRPIAAQPTVRDSMSFMATFAGLMESLPRNEHPVIDQDWSVARENFYAAAREGFTSDQRWITNSGEETTDTEMIYDDIFSHAVEGLRNAGCTESDAVSYVAPLRARVESGITPARWKRDRVRDRVENGEPLGKAIPAMQRAYVDEQTETLLDGAFTDWWSQ
ncbi:hypothetical protein [Haloplanus aerogenes]|uniref:Glutamate--cysteine ligase n=1 Tax=Haloplanus aerogenes TaxID=660522 RepID=A0A3M0ECZ2_9EURY|nr:hypothetical protein [Haloplanus aerogenes]AZH25844.1 hypothetical protein DU502_10855 [Haloplanus aerogenes]RMB25590.1 hypothetical protein ATH50_0687 [Haloplanus aerogenes]